MCFNSRCLKVQMEFGNVVVCFSHFNHTTINYRFAQLTLYRDFHFIFDKMNPNPVFTSSLNDKKTLILTWQRFSINWLNLQLNKMKIHKWSKAMNKEYHWSDFMSENVYARARNLEIDTIVNEVTTTTIKQDNIHFI